MHNRGPFFPLIVLDSMSEEAAIFKIMWVLLLPNKHSHYTSISSSRKEVLLRIRDAFLKDSRQPWHTITYAVMWILTLCPMKERFDSDG